MYLPKPELLLADQIAVNAGYAKDKLMKIGEQESEGAEVQDNKWLFKNKDHGMMSAAASVGMLLLWDIEQGLNEIDRYLHDSNNYIQAGALLAMGIVHSGVRHDCDPVRTRLQCVRPLYEILFHQQLHRFCKRTLFKQRAACGGSPKMVVAWVRCCCVRWVAGVAGTGWTAI